MGFAPNFFVCVVYVAPIGSKHERKFLFQNLAANITKVQTLRGIVLLEGDFNVRTAMLLDTIDTSDLCELLQAPKLVESEQPGTMPRRHNHDDSVGSWGHELLDLCCDVGLLIFNGQMPNDESGEFICLANGGRNTINYIVGSLIV
jgi:hypothetical protein